MNPYEPAWGQIFGKNMVSRKRLFPLSFPFQNGQFRPSCGQLVFLGGNERPRVRLFLRKQSTNVFCNDAGVRFYRENKVKTQSAAMSKRISSLALALALALALSLWLSLSCVAASVAA